ncbi:MAG: porin [bacterium]
MRRTYCTAKGSAILWIFLGVLFIGQLFVCVSIYSREEQQCPTVQLCGFTQAWAQYDETAGSSHGGDAFIPRARIGIKGDLLPAVNYMVLTEWGRLTFDDPVTLLDAWINLRLHQLCNIKIGQTWYKFSLSGTTPLPEIPFVFRPEAVDAIWLPMGRNGLYSYDRGVEISGSAGTEGMPWGYIVSVTAGPGLAQFEDNDEKDFTGRLWFEPVPRFRVGASGFYGWSSVDVQSNLGSVETMDIPEYAYGFEASCKHGSFRMIAEYLQGRYDEYGQSSQERRLPWRLKNLRAGMQWQAGLFFRGWKSRCNTPGMKRIF